MASHDLRDVLNLPSDNTSGPRPNKKQKTGGARPNLKGLAREVQNLSGDNPISIVPEVSIFKKRRYASRKPAAPWELRPFGNSAREDNGALVLRHWRRKTEDGEPPDPTQEGDEPRPAEEVPAEGEQNVAKLEDSSFVKFNVRVPVPQYNEDQYASNLQHNDWTKEETDYLLELAQEYDLRWSIIWDRYEFVPRAAGEDGANSSTAVVPVLKPRGMEDLKARYYEVAAKMMAVQKPAQYMTRPEFELYETMQNFDPAQERSRKEFALATMARSKDEAREEESLLLEIKRILARTERFNEERRELYNRLDFPATDSDINSFKSSAGLQALLQNLMNVDKSKKRKSIMPGEGVSPQSAVPNSAASEAPPNRRESIAASASGRRDSIAGTPATPIEPTSALTNPIPGNAGKKKGAQQPERRKLTPLEEQTYGVTYHDRLGSGPTFRYEKINKLYSHKSGQQQARITNVLTELDIPPRLVMPTAAVTAQFEQLWSAVITLVDLRKASDRIDADIKIEEAKKAERDKAKGGASTSAGASSSAEAPIKGEDEASEQRASEATNGVAPAAEPIAEVAETRTSGSGGPTDGKEEHAVERERGPGGLMRPGSSGAHKRSASVLSTTSDKSTKRQKK
ncbi:hypothetical protein B0T25DRAFT_505578 [Lasiosphaeria hispida]|uniref:SWR1-complex protein 4 n=1 Tax=Lasiosphaeria hispida TaxID=260671 RepID=A0AAJ0MD20_9PEZI|nr:hypothetical protein B0T25DRAFT_505578 [Lasiosphaeria hispida]